jgi:hypothetical protein
MTLVTWALGTRDMKLKLTKIIALGVRTSRVKPFTRCRSEGIAEEALDVDKNRSQAISASYGQGSQLAKLLWIPS